MKKASNSILDKYKPLVKMVAETFGKNCEVVLHDFTDLQDSIIAIEHGHVTGRDLGSPMTELSLKKVSAGKFDDIYNYTGKSADGRSLKSSTTFIKNEQDEVIGCFCINFDMTELVASRRVLDEIMKTSESKETKIDDTEENKVNNVLTDIVKTTIESVGKPVAYLTKEEKVIIVNKLDNQGAFLIKGAIDYVAKVLCVSRYTIYNYLDEIRVEK